MKVSIFSLFSHFFPFLHIYLNHDPGIYIDGSRGQPPPRLAIPAHGFASQHSISSFESHLGHVIRPISPNSSHRSSLHLEGLHVPRTTSTNGSISSRLYRHAMTPRIGIRTSLFSAIEVKIEILVWEGLKQWKNGC